MIDMDDNKYVTPQQEKRIPKKSRREQDQCKHDWYSRLVFKASWRLICVWCGAKSR